MPRCVMVGLILCLSLLRIIARGDALPSFDFSKPEDLKRWHPAHDISRFEGLPDGVRITIVGTDPYLAGPRVDFPEGVPLRMTIKLKSDTSGVAQIYYIKDHAAEEDSVRFEVKGGEWQKLRINLPPLGKATGLRFDPPGASGSCLLTYAKFEPRVAYAEPAWPKPVVPTIPADVLSVTSGDLKLVHDGKTLGSFQLQLAGKPMGIGLNRSVIGYLKDAKPQWVALDETTRAQVTRGDGSLKESAAYHDADGATWALARRYSPGKQAGTIDVETTLTVDRDRDVLFVPMFAMLPGVGSFGEDKTQAVFPGLEYLDREPSSSEADVTGPASKRQVPAARKVTFPLMAVSTGSSYVGLIWEQSPTIAAVFDSPDRLFHSGGHVLGLLLPGSDGSNRVEGSLLPQDVMPLKAGKAIVVKATIIAGQGSDVTAAVKQYVALRGLPLVPAAVGGFETFAKTAAAGWLDSKARAEALYRHAYPGHYDPRPAADAAMWQQWLAGQVEDAGLRQRLIDAARAAVAAVNPVQYNGAAVGHIRYPVESLLFGHVADNAADAEQRCRSLIGRFEADGSLRYRPGKVDYGRTHFASEANGHTAAVVASILRDASVAGDPKLIADGLRLLRAMDKFTGSVPRGAQTWECALHTPDIYASAHLVRAYVLGYELSGDEALLERAKYWAWTGVPFIYLDSQEAPVGPYASIAVFGATNWVAPVWMGLPVQWCGLCYADGLYDLAAYDPHGPWKQLADGITASALPQVWPIGSDPERVGLLPDSYSLGLQSRSDPGINPATLQPCALRLFDKPPVYTMHCFRAAGLIVHAPGKITEPTEAAGKLSFTVESWTDQPYFVLVTGLKAKPRVTIGGKEMEWAEPNQYAEGKGRLILQVKGKTVVEVGQ